MSIEVNHAIAISKQIKAVYAEIARLEAELQQHRRTLKACEQLLAEVHST